MEFVFVVKREDLFNLAYPQGFLPLSQTELESSYVTKIRAKGFFLERRKAEGDSGFKQIIPYCVVMQEQRVLLLRRLKAQGESRLHNKLSIGVGGHINPIDAQGDLLELATKRELHEELHCDGNYRIRPVGLINDDSTEVGAVHFGLVYRVEMLGGQIAIREKKLMEGSFVSIEELKDLHDGGESFETWSSFLVQNLENIIFERKQ